MRYLLFISIFFLLFANPVFAQNWMGTSTPTSTGDYNTLIQLTHNSWGSHHGILFNATRRVPYNDGNLLDNGNVQHAFATGPYGSGAGAIMFLGNGGSMEFLVSPASNGAGQPVDWGGPKLTIQRNGFVGVGTGSPSSKLHVHNDNVLPQPTGSNVLLSRLSGRASTNTFMRNEWLVRDNNTTTDWLTTRFHDAISIDGSFLNPRVDTRVWWERDPMDNIQSWGDQGNTYLTINQGNVGIGTTTPQNKLDVNGTVHAKEVKVDLTGWPDYVFNDDYKLLSLAEIKTYIDKNKHLPEVPSAKEMEANGVNLGEMNMLLLKKIEELTLYILNQEKRISELENNKNK